MSILTATDIKALRKCDALAVDWYTDKDGTEVSQLRAIKRADPKEPFATDITYRIALPSRLTDYAARYTSAPRDTNRSGFALMSTSEFNEVVHTALGFLRVDDDIALRWLADNNSGTLSDAGLHSDELRLEVIRGNKRYTFVLEHRVSLDNFARLFRSSRGW